MTFFRPRRPFLTWLVRRADRRVVYDVGCGDCCLLQLLWTAGVKVIGIDSYPMGEPEMLTLVGPNRLPVVPGIEAQRSAMLREQPGLVIFARPSHGGWVEEVIDLLHPDSEVIYISKPQNLKIDLPTFKTVPLRHNCGEDREVAYLVMRKERP